MGMMQEFKQFASRGNVVDLAVGIIIGGAFGKIVSSAVSDLLMPPLGWMIGGLSFTDLKFTFKTELLDVKPVTINYGNFLQTCVDFLIVAFAVFLLIKAMNRFHQKQETAPAAPPAPSKQELLLEEIRDLLKKK
ncbi:MAG TPA: large-conductance mechanosensitive channel protein MscL [bacterium]|nr:large-conductance mechanosensitive channel protein MscL [bacterium]HMW31775.1 large-conductance mechanosensitive channel protein MscL [bacterium]HMW36150.1 large-conductance mechanosensitive channel protein MscL [bacterium]HMY35711.1 large-conductance mechanosensitive channel protein MscL [bacterium]HMZ02921.1 large-conductance mechanosensitive channel protein MscL [bacterium]